MTIGMGGLQQTAFNIPKTGITTTADPTRGGLSGNANDPFGLIGTPANKPAGLNMGSFTIPTNLFPSSTSSSNQSSYSGSSSGINWNTPFMKSLQPQLNTAAENLRPDIEGMGQTLQDQYANLMRRGMGPEAFQGTLNSLANRGMLNSTVAGDSMAGAQKGIARMIADQQFNSLLAQQQALQNIPNVLANLAQLGQENRSSSSSGSTSKSYQANPLAPYELMSRLFMYQPTVQG